MLDSSLNLPLRATLCLAMLLLIGCATDTVISVLPVAGKVLQPDRALVHDFEVAPESGRLERGNKAQTAEEIRVGKILAEALSKNLVNELQSYGINASLARGAAPPEDDTVSLMGQFMHIEEGGQSNLVEGFVFGDRLRTRILIFQGSGLYSQFIAEADSATQTGLKSGMEPGAEMAAPVRGATTGDGGSDRSRVANEAFFSIVEADAQRAAKVMAERIANYYRKRGWLKP